MKRVQHLKNALRGIFPDVDAAAKNFHRRIQHDDFHVFAIAGEKYGIRQAGFWTVAIGESSNDLYYMLAWESLAEREKKWSAFGSDPDWIKARIQTETEAGGPLTTNMDNYILAPTSYSAVK